MRVCIIVLCLAAVCALVVGCEGPAPATQPAGGPAAQPAVTAAEKPAAPAAKRLGPYEPVSNWLDEEGFIANWLVIGPFPNPGDRPDNKGFDTDYLGGEANYVPANGAEVAKEDGTKVKWAQYNSPDPEINFSSIEQLGLEYGQEDILTYSACWLELKEDADVEIRVGSDDGYKLWIDHKLIGAEHVYRAAATDQEVYPIKLSKGMHLVMMKVDQDWGEYEFMLRVVTPDGKTVPGIKVWN